MTALYNIITLLENTFNKEPWHGPSVKSVINGITQQQSLSKLNNSHSIIELVGHMTSWRTYTAKKLIDDKSFKMTDELNFPSATDWQKVLQTLDESQVTLIEAIKKFDEKRLPDIVPSTNHQYSYYTLLHGIIHHDLYHTGQIAIVKKHFGF
jgi:uncharacterized damage-inducible protein DinB